MSIDRILDRAYDLSEGLQVKVIRHVRTPAGQRRFNQPIGSIIVADRKLRNLTGLEPEYEGWERAKGSDGKEYSIGYDDDSGKWIATEGSDSWDAVVEADSEEEIYDRLDAHAGKGGKGKGGSSGGTSKPKPVPANPKRTGMVAAANVKPGDIVTPSWAPDSPSRVVRVGKVTSTGRVTVYYDDDSKQTYKINERLIAFAG